MRAIRFIGMFLILHKYDQLVHAIRMFLILHKYNRKFVVILSVSTCDSLECF